MSVTKWALTIVIGALLVGQSMAQDDAPRRGEGRGGRGPRAGQARDFRPPPNPILQALDADNDGEISAEEIENATTALKKLDRNEDGKLTRDELAPRRRGPGGDARRFNPETFIARMMERDKDEDGKLSKDELPERMQRGFDRMDKNGDGYLTRDELEQMSHRFSGRRGGDRPGGGDDSDRPRRPRRPQRPE